MKYILAILACAGLFVLYAILGGAVFGWEHGGGAIPLLILLTAMGATWRAITKNRGPKMKENQLTDPTTAYRVEPKTENSGTFVEGSKLWQYELSKSISMTPAESLAYELAMKEANEPSSRNGGVWARAFADALGDETRTRALYTKYRAAILFAEITDEDKRIEGIRGHYKSILDHINAGRFDQAAFLIKEAKMGIPKLSFRKSATTTLEKELAAIEKSTPQARKAYEIRKKESDWKEEKRDMFILGGAVLLIIIFILLANFGKKYQQRITTNPHAEAIR